MACSINYPIGCFPDVYDTEFYTIKHENPLLSSKEIDNLIKLKDPGAWSAHKMRCSLDNRNKKQALEEWARKPIFSKIYESTVYGLKKIYDFVMVIFIGILKCVCLIAPQSSISHIAINKKTCNTTPPHTL